MASGDGVVRDALLTETDERRALREAVAGLVGGYGREYFQRVTRDGERPDALWSAMGAAGFLGVAIPEEHGGGGGGLEDLALVIEETAAQGCPMFMLVISPAIAGSLLVAHGSPAQRAEWLPGIADGTKKVCFAITEPDAGTNTHEITTTAHKDGDGGWRLRGQKYWTSGIDEADAVLVVARSEDGKPTLFLVPTDSPGLSWQKIDSALQIPENSFTTFYDDVPVPADAIVGAEGAGLKAMFAGLNPERVTAAAQANGIARYAIRRGARYASERTVWSTPIGAHQRQGAEEGPPRHPPHLTPRAGWAAWSTPPRGRPRVRQPPRQDTHDQRLRSERLTSGPPVPQTLIKQLSGTGGTGGTCTRGAARGPTRHGPEWRVLPTSRASLRAHRSLGKPVHLTCSDDLHQPAPSAPAAGDGRFPRHLRRQVRQHRDAAGAGAGGDGRVVRPRLRARAALVAERFDGVEIRSGTDPRILVPQLATALAGGGPVESAILAHVTSGAGTSGIGRRRAAARDEGGAAYRERRAEIVAAAARTFNRNGYRGTTLSDVAEALGMDRASLYYYIGSKEELFHEVVEGAVEANASAAEAIRDGPGRAPDKLRRLVTSLMVSYGETYPFLYVYIQENLGRDRSPWAREMRRHNKRYENAVVGIVQAGVDEGTLRTGTEPWVVAFGIIGMVAWSNRWFDPNDCAVGAAEIGAAYADALLGGLEVP